MNGNTPDVGVMMTAVVQRSMDMVDIGWTVSTAPSAVQLPPHVAVSNQTFLFQLCALMITVFVRLHPMGWMLKL